MELKNTVFGVSLGQGLGLSMTGQQNIQQILTESQNVMLVCQLGFCFLIIQQHVRDSATDGEQTSRFWALQGAL